LPAQFPRGEPCVTLYGCFTFPGSRGASAMFPGNECVRLLAFAAAILAGAAARPVWAGEAPQDSPEITLWSLKKPVRPPVPTLKRAEPPQNPIDAFVLARLEERGLAAA